MGASQSQIYNDDLFTEFKKEHWRRDLDLGLYELWENTQTGELCEAYKLDYVPQQQELQHYRFRHYNQNADNFVQIRYVDVQKKQSLCYHGQSYVLTEFIPIKLSDMQDLTFPQACSILNSAFRAFHIMEAFHGPFIPNEQLIGINLNGRPKIWLNKNHSKNKAQKQIKAEIWQKHMGQVSENVKRIIQITQQKLKDKRFPTQFRDYFYDNVMNFSQASQYVEQYCQKYHITIPQRIQYIKYLDDQQVIKTVNEYLSKYNKNDVLQDRTNDLNNVLQAKENKLVRQQNGVRIMSRNGSQQNVVINNQLVQQQKPQLQSHYVPANNLQFKPIVINNGAPIQRTVLSPTAVPRSSTLQMIVPPPLTSTTTITNPVYRRQQRRLSTNKVVFVQPSSQLPPPKIQSNKIIPIIPSNVIIPNEVRKVIDNKVTQTPRHIATTNHVTFIPPSRITQYQRPIRTQVSQVKQVLISPENIIPFMMRKKQQQHSIHEKMRQFQNENSQQQQQSQYHHLQQQQKHEINHQSQLIVDDNRQQRRQQLQKQVKHYFFQQQQQFQHGYINDDSQYVPQQHLNEDDNRTSQPDWQVIRRHQLQKQQLQQQHYNFQIKHEHVDHLLQQQRTNYDIYYEKQQLTQQKIQQYHPNDVSVDNNGNEISPIKSSGQKNVGQFVGHYDMFSKYAKGNNMGGNDYYEKHQQYDQQVHYNQQRGNTVMNSFENRLHNNNKTYQLNQSQNVSQHQQPQSLQQSIQLPQQHHHPTQSQHPSHQQTPHNLSQSQQRLRHLSSKNTSINRGTRQQSSGTMVIHESKENIYQGVLQEKFDKIVIANIQQQKYEGEENGQQQQYRSGSGRQQQQQQPHEQYQRRDFYQRNNIPYEVKSQQQQQQQQQSSNHHYAQSIQNNDDNNTIDHQHQQQQLKKSKQQQQEQQFIQQSNRIMQQAVRQMEQQRLRQLYDQQRQYRQKQQRQYQQNMRQRYGRDQLQQEEVKYKQQNQLQGQYQQHQQKQYDQYQQRQQYQYQKQRQQQQLQLQQHDNQQQYRVNVHQMIGDDQQQQNESGVYQQGEQQLQYQQQQNQQQQQHQQQQQEQQHHSKTSNTSNQYDNLHFRNQSQQLYQYTPVQSVYKKQSGHSFNYHPVPRPHYPSGVQQITQIQSHQDIQNYIRNKYSNLIGHPTTTGNTTTILQQPKQQVQILQQGQQVITRKRSNKDYNTRAMTFAKPAPNQQQHQQDVVDTNQYNQHDQYQLTESQQHQQQQQQKRIYNNDILRVESYHENIQQLQQQQQQQNHHNDFLDVGNLQKSLDRKYKYNKQPQQQQQFQQRPKKYQQQPISQQQYDIQSPKQQNIRNSQASQQDGMNIAALDQRLQKFQQRQSIQREKSQRKLQTYTEQLSARNNNPNNSSSNQLNFNQFDNIVQLMDRKIQQSQKKQKEVYNNNTNEMRERDQHNVSDYSLKQDANYNHYQFDDIALQTSINNNNPLINNNDLSLKNIPILGRQEISIASNSKPPSKRDYVKNYGFDSEDFATGRQYSTYQYQPISRNQSYKSNKRTSQNVYDNQYKVLSPVAEMEKKYQGYSPRNLQNFSTEALPKYTIESGRQQQNDYSRRSSRRSTRNNENAKMIADKIADKYEKYINDSSASGKPFSKKSYYDSGASYESSKNQSSAYADYSSKYNTKDSGSYPSNREIHRKRSSYLNPIEQLNVQHNPSPYREQQISPKSIVPLQFANPISTNRQNISKYSNSSSRIGSKTNIGGGEKPGKSSRVSYDQLRDLLWK